MKDDDLKASLEKLRRAADQLEQGPAGPPGPPPDHEWHGTELRFEKPDGEWGRYVDLRGPRGQTAIGVTAPPFDMNSLPVGDPSITPEEIAVRQSGEWFRLTFAAFVSLIDGSGQALPISLDGAALSLDGLTLSLH